MNKTLRTTLGFVFLFIAGFCLWQAVPASARREATMSPPVQAEFNSLRNVTENGVAGIPIRDIRVGQRVLAHNPEVSDAERESWGEEPDFGRWLHLKLEMPKEDGGILHINILRPEEWVESQLGYVVAEAEESSRHAPRDEAKRDKSPASEDSRREEKTSHATFADESILTAISNVKDSGATAMPHHAERDGDVGGTEPQASSVDEFPLPLVPLSPLRPIYFNLAMRSAAIGAAGAELVGLTVEMDLPEMGASGTAIITEILPASQIEPRMSSDDDRQVVTATFRHPPSNQILDVNFVSEADWQRQQFSNPNARDLKPETQNLNPIGEADIISVTDNHLFWSVDQQEFVEVGQMEIGEQVQTFHGETKRLASRLPRPGPPEEVFNLEVYGEHVYFADQLLVHNNCFLDDIINNPHVADAAPGAATRVGGGTRTADFGGGVTLTDSLEHIVDPHTQQLALGFRNNFGQPQLRVAIVNSRGHNTSVWRNTGVGRTQELRNQFNSTVRAAFLRHIARPGGEAEALVDLNRLNHSDLRMLRSGLTPDGWVTHHVDPLFRGGDNAFSNLRFIRKNFHQDYFQQLHWFGDGYDPFRRFERFPLLGTQ